MEDPTLQPRPILPSIPAPHRAVLDAVLSYIVARGVPDGASNRSPPKSNAADAAQNLLAAVRALPEFAPVEPESEVGRRNPDAELTDLMARVTDLDRARPSDKRFQLEAEELAARARRLQGECPELWARCSTVIRRLTALAAARSVFVFGLRRAHEADWKAQANRARAHLDRIANRVDTPAPDTERTPEARTSAVRCSPAREEPTLELPGLRRAADSQAVVVVGGAAKDHVRDRIASRAGLELEWIETRGGGTRLVEAVIARVKNGSVAALVLVEGAMLHRHSEPLVAAARRAGTPVAYARKGGVGQVLGALGEVERKLVERAAA